MQNVFKKHQKWTIKIIESLWIKYHFVHLNFGVVKMARFSLSLAIFGIVAVSVLAQQGNKIRQKVLIDNNLNYFLKNYACLFEFYIKFLDYFYWLKILWTIFLKLLGPRRFRADNATAATEAPTQPTVAPTTQQSGGNSGSGSGSGSNQGSSNQGNGGNSGKNCKKNLNLKLKN